MLLIQKRRSHPGRRASVLVLGAYVMWGFLPLYWPYLRPAVLTEIVAHRAVWSFVFAAATVAVLGRAARVRALAADRRVRRLLVVSTAALAVNWLVFVGAADRGEEVDISLGYFISPLLTIVIGRFVLREHVRPWQWAAVAAATAGVVVLTVDAGGIPVVGFGLAASWALYGLAKKQAQVGALESLTFETALIAPISIGYLVWLAASAPATAADPGALHAVLLVGSGLVTLVPLLLFSAGAPALPMVALGPIQYTGPVIQFVVGVLLLGNAMSPGRWLGFVLIWVALVGFVAEGVAHGRVAARRRPAPVPSIGPRAEGAV